MKLSFNTLFNPDGIAVVGVSSDPNKLGSVVFKNILREGYKGGIYPINPKYDKLQNRICYSKVSDISKNVDLVVIVVPAEFVLEIVKDCSVKKVKGVVIISSGFKESGPEGAKLEEQIVKVCIENEIQLIGPNCLGIISTPNNLNASFATETPAEGNISFLSQSGAFNTAVLDLAENRNLGFKDFVSLGNKAGVNELDLLDHWLKDKDTSVIGAYIEQFKDGKGLIKLISHSPRKPIVLLHSGESKHGQYAAISHTGSLAGSAQVIKTALKQAGILKVETIEEMFSALMGLSWSKLPTGNRVAVITNAGGPGIILTDMLSQAGFELPALTQETVRKLKKLLPPAASVANPVDLLGDALAERYCEAIKLIGEDPEIDCVLVLLTPQLVTQIEETAKFIASYLSDSPKPVIPIFVGEKNVMPGLKRLWDNKVAAFQYPEDALAALKHMLAYSQIINRPSLPAKHPKSTTPKYKKEVETEFSSGKKALSAELVTMICDEVGLEIPNEAVAHTIDQAVQLAREIGFPLVAKATTEDVIHKTDSKLIYLNIRTENDLISSFNQLSKSLAQLTGKSQPAILLQPMLTTKEELILGINKDSVFGYVLVFGKGGIYTEVFNDVSTRMVGIDQSEIEKMILETKVSQILYGARGLERLAVEKLTSAIEAVQKMVDLYPQINSIDINPLMIDEKDCIAADVKIFLDNPNTSQE